MTAGTLDETIATWSSEPDKARSAPTVTARAEDGQAVIEAGPFTWRADLPTSLGGTNKAPSPTALLLGALAGCGVVFLRDTLAPQFGLTLDDVRATASCRSDAAGLLGIEGTNPALDQIELRIEVSSPDPADRLDAMFAAWRERCPIYLALINPNQITVGLEVAATAR